MVTTGFTAAPPQPHPSSQPWTDGGPSAESRPLAQGYRDDEGDEHEGDGEGDGDDDDDDGETIEGHDTGNELLNETTVKSGYLAKRGEKRKTWKKRWFVLRSSKLAYYKNDKEYQLLRFIDVGDIKTVASVELKKNENTFGIVTPKRTFYVKASSRHEMEAWIAALNDVKVQYAQRNTLTSEIAAVDLGQDASTPTATATATSAVSPQRSESQDRSKTAGGSGARPISIHIPGKGSYVAPAQPRPIPGSNAFSPLTVTSESDIGAERFGLSYTSSTGQSMAGSPGRFDHPAPGFLSGGHSPGGHYSGSDASEQGHFQGRGSHGFGSFPRQRSISAGRSKEPPASPGPSSQGQSQGQGHGQGQGQANVLSSSEEEDDWDEDEAGDRAMPLPGHNDGGIAGTGQQAAYPPQPSQTQQQQQQPAAGGVASPVNSDFLRDPNKVITQGYLMKQSSRRKVWRKRWFILTGSSLMYTRSHMDAKAHRRIPISSMLDAIEYESKKLPVASPSSPSLGSSATMPFGLGSFAAGGGGGPTPGQEGGSGPEGTAATGLVGAAGAQPQQPERMMPERRPSMVAAAAGVASNVGANVGMGMGMGGSKKKKENCFKVISPKRTYLLCAPSEEEEIKWLSALKTLINRQRNASAGANAGSTQSHSQPQGQAATPSGTTSGGIGGSSSGAAPAAAAPPSLTKNPSTASSATISAQQNGAVASGTQQAMGSPGAAGGAAATTPFAATPGAGDAAAAGAAAGGEGGGFFAAARTGRERAPSQGQQQQQPLSPPRTQQAATT
ncbi:uncharacterized protein PFL1_00291 [Pseudozyma flocculosa PF-1]|uniref:Related to tandem ph domain-containing protein-2 (Tapp2) n=1 Tax=Pseudozyma flocculosa TaxID=84751 RepID=A0A5C3ETH8_9BASI|nr:uncharacterized protein PFL1_00291 [Pseudozyma flocculosa PF-1]EPQ32094.1 hypothetical protein PFL1_00291 [Pseudozyma flocculosa PF-1]SPO34975.1 related to tandem ph domain-containing protein-2 (tapp2) [Pseudozyma flocculosa]